MSELQGLLTSIIPVLFLQNDVSPFYKACIILCMYIFNNINVFKKYSNTLIEFIYKRQQPLTFTVYAKISQRASGTHNMQNGGIMNEFMNYIYKLIKSGKIDTHNLNIYRNPFPSTNLESPMITFKDPSKIMYVTDTIGLSVMEEKTNIKYEEEGIELTSIKYTVRVITKDNDINTIDAFLKQISKEYEDDSAIDNRKYVYYLKNMESDTKPYITCFRVKYSKSFESMFFEGKQKLVSVISNFMESRDTYVRLGMPYTFGALFHGEPGTGKTSAIKAIANMTGREIFIVQTNKVNTRDKLLHLFSGENYLHGLPDRNKIIYVFEEIDCGAWGDIVCRRDVCKKENNDGTTSGGNGDIVKIMKEMVAGGGGGSGGNGSKNDKEEIDITLADILEILDGIVEMDGRMIIMTSNHPEKLDPALLRPGRIDICMEFKRMTRKNVADMYKRWFDADMPNDVFEHVKDYVYTQADIGKIFKMRNLDDIHIALCNTA